MILVLSLLTVTLSGCVEEESVMPTQPIAQRVEVDLTPTPTQPQEVSHPEQIKLSGSGPGIKGMYFIDVLEKYGEKKRD